MANDITGIHSARTGQAGDRTTRRLDGDSGRSQPGTGTGSSGGGDDKVSLTATAARLKDLEQRLATDSPPFDAERVNRMKQAIASGEYRVDAGRVADKMIDFEKSFDE